MWAPCHGQMSWKVLRNWPKWFSDEKTMAIQRTWMYRNEFDQFLNDRYGVDPNPFETGDFEW